MPKMCGAAEAGLIRRATDGVNRLMLEQQELIGDGPGPALRGKPIL
jgi:hypothetical protein